jgi:hypothetical protein
MLGMTVLIPLPRPSTFVSMTGILFGLFEHVYQI